MNQNEKTREMLNGKFVFPNIWEELNPEEANIFGGWYFYTHFDKQ